MKETVAQPVREILPSNLTARAESIYDQLVCLHGQNNIAAKTQIAFRSAIKYFLRIIFDDKKVRQYAPKTSQLSLIERATAELSSDEKIEVIRLLSKMEKERCQQAVEVALQLCDIHKDQIELHGSILREDVWPTDLDIIIHANGKSIPNITKFKELLASSLSKKVDIRIK